MNKAHKKVWIAVCVMVILIGACLFAMAYAADAPTITESVYLSDLEMKSWVMYQSSSEDENPLYRPSINSSEGGGPLVINGVTYEKGLRSHPLEDGSPAMMVYDISKLNYSYFSATVGKDAAGGEGDIQFYILLDGEKIAESPILSGNNMDYTFKDVLIKGGKELTLCIDPAGDFHWDSAAYGNPLLYNLSKDPDPTEAPTSSPKPEYDDRVYVSDLDCTYWIMWEASSEDEHPQFRPSFDHNESGGPLVINGVTYEKGIRSHPREDQVSPAELVFDISEYSTKFEYFVAVVGRDATYDGQPGNVAFEVLVDGNSVARSPELTYGEDYVMVAPVKGGKELTLLIDPTADGCSNDSAIFGDARLCNLQTLSVELKELPSKVTYAKGEALNPAGGMLTVNMENDITMEVAITADMLSGYDPETLGKQTVTVTYNGQTVTFEVTVENAAASPSARPDDNPYTGEQDNKGGLLTWVIVGIMASAVILITARMKRSRT